MLFRSASPLLLLASLAGCAVGPNYKGPPATVASGGIPAQFAHAGQTAAPAPGRWWAAFSDPTLDELESRALAGSPDVAVAEARVRAARSALRIEKTNALPRTDVQLSTIQSKLPGVELSQNRNGSGKQDDNFDFYNAGFDASWELDLFGGQHRKIEAARASLAAVEADAADARLSLTADVAMAYAELRDRQQRIALARADSEIAHRSLALLEQRLDRGTVSPLDVDRMRVMVETADADLAPLLAEAESRANALAILTGAAPGALDSLLSAAAPVPLPPASVAVGDPAALLQRRPDIRAAERRLAAETARIGAATAARFPRVRLFGIVGLGGSSPSDITDLDKVALLAAPSLQWDVVDFGRGAARVHQAEARRDEAEALWRKTVLAALADAQDALTRFGQRRAALASLARANAAAEHAATLSSQRFEAGTVTLVEMQEAQRQAIAVEQRLVSTRALLAMDFIALQKALGLAWQSPSS
jgi:NodT family efflux transporter outer membrane factor (OMF) lipoprotein